MKKRLCGFTLVELVVVIVIIVVLTAVGFIAYESYVSDSRDSKRLALLNELRDSLRIYSVEYDLPLPDDSIELRQDGKVFGYQGYAGETMLETLNFSDIAYDPKDKVFFTYNVTADRDKFQLMGYLENEPINSLTIFPQTHSRINYNKRYTKVFGENLGILIEQVSREPIQQVEPFRTQGYIDFELDTSGLSFEAQIGENQTLEGVASDFLGLVPFTTCKKLLFDGITTSGLYIINPTGDKPTQVYCDMETDGGGWTFTTFVSKGGGNLNLFTGGAGAYRADRNIAANSYGLDTTSIPHDAIYFVRKEPDVTQTLLDEREVFYAEIDNYKNPIFNMPYLSDTTYHMRFGFTGALVSNTYRYKRDPNVQYYQVCLRKPTWTGLGMCLRTDGTMEYPNDYARTDEVFYNTGEGTGSSGETSENIWYYVR